MRTYAALGLATVLMGGCATQTIPLVQISQVEKLQLDLKRQIGTYNNNAAYYRLHPDLDPAKPLDGTYVCGNGNVNFNVVSVKLDLVTTTDNTNKLTLGATFAPLTWLTGGLSATTSGENTNTQELVFVEYPDALKDTEVSVPLPTDSAPIAQVLLNLREQLIAGAKTPNADAQGRPIPRQCFRDYQKGEKDPPHSFKIAVTFVTDVNTQTPTLKPAIFSLSGSADEKDTTQNTITVAFQQRITGAPGEGEELTGARATTKSAERARSTVKSDEGLMGDSITLNVPDVPSAKPSKAPTTTPPPR